MAGLVCKRKGSKTSYKIDAFKITGPLCKCMRSNYAQVVNKSSDDFLSSALNIPIFLIAFRLISHRSPPFASSLRPRPSTLNPLLILIGFAIVQQI